MILVYFILAEIAAVAAAWLALHAERRLLAIAFAVVGAVAGCYFFWAGTRAPLYK